jgi:hypothetical protein
LKFQKFGKYLAQIVLYKRKQNVVRLRKHRTLTGISFERHMLKGNHANPANGKAVPVGIHGQEDIVSTPGLSQIETVIFSTGGS